MTIATVTYTYGSGADPNREINFVRIGAPGTRPILWAKVTVIGTGELIGEIPENVISVQMDSERQRILTGKAFLPDKRLSEFLLFQQDQIVQSIRQIGGRWITPNNGSLMGPGGNEIVTSLKITNPG